MNSLQRRLFGGSRVYWRAKDIERIAKRFGASMSDVADLVSRNAPAQIAPVTKQEAGAKAGGMFRFTLSSNALDAHGDTVNVNGWDFGRVSRNFPALAFHDHTLPIGKWINRTIEGGKLKATLKLSNDGYAQKLGRQIEEGVLIAASVGFIPGTWEWSSDKSRPDGIDFIKGHQLLEASVCSIGSCPDALLEATVAAKSATPALDAARRRMAKLKGRLR